MDHQLATLLRKGEEAARSGQRSQARQLFRRALNQDPDNVPALLWMAWLSDDPRSSLAFAERALDVDPENERARSAQRWAASELDTSVQKRPTSQKLSGRKRRLLLAVAVGFLIAFALGVLLIILWFSLDLQPAIAAFVATSSPTAVATWTPAPSDTLTPTSTQIDTPRPTSTPSETPTPQPSSTPTATPTVPPSPTPTPTASATPRPSPTATDTPSPTDPPPSATPEDVSPTETPTRGEARWINVDLSAQTLTAYEGNTPVRSTLVSTGLPNTPTPVGEYRIYIKLRYDDMSGPGYYLRDVPYTMYFYRGYGIHGTYWHSNFGQPMSHGCINLPTPEAEWLFQWASVGTLVKIHS